MGIGRAPWADGEPHRVSWRSPCGYSRLGEVEVKGNSCKFWGRYPSEAKTGLATAGVVREY